MSDTIFERHEAKYLLSDRQRAAVIRALGSRMDPDPHGESTICSVYYDTPDLRLARDSLEKPVYKEKLRLRSYGPARPQDAVFMELKKKYKGVVYKRRVSLPAGAAEAFLRGEAPLPEDSQIGREIDWFCRFYGGLAPAAYLCYDRAAYFAKDDPELRLTFDRDIRWRSTGLSLSEKPGGAPLLGRGESLLEVKTPGAMPLWLARLLDAQAIYPASFSKYGRACRAMLEEPAPERSVSCA